MVKNWRVDEDGLVMYPVYHLGKVSNDNEPQSPHLQTTLQEME